MSVTIGEICDIIMGQSPPGYTYNREHNGIPFFQGKTDFGDVHPTASTWCNAPKKIAEPNDVLISVRAPVGPTNLCSTRCCIGRGLAAIRPKEGVDHRYTFYFLRNVKHEISGLGTGSTFSAISKSQIYNLQIPLPPLPEQRRIVARIEELFTRLEAGVEELRKAKAQLRRYRQAVLKHTFEGKLTEEWRKENIGKMEPASVLLERIKKNVGATLAVARNKNKRAGASPAPTNDLPPLPEGWVWTRVGEIVEDVEKVDPKIKPRKEFIYLDIASVDNTNRKITMPKKYLGKDAPSRARQLVKSGDILFSTVRTYLKNIAIVNECYDGQIASTGFCVIRPLREINNKFIFFLTQTDDFLNPLTQLQRGTSYPAVRDSDVSSQSIPLPPLPEQHKIVEEIERWFSVADAVEKTVENSLKQAERLRQSILKRAFEGKLVPQDPSDEPAGVLLERIRLQRQQSEQEVKPRRRKASG